VRVTRGWAEPLALLGVLVLAPFLRLHALDLAEFKRTLVDSKPFACSGERRSVGPLLACFPPSP
jgi:hypothetical protein